MDLSSMKWKMEREEYMTAQDFHADFKFMIENRRVYQGTAGCDAGADLNKLFDEKWKGLPPLIEPEEEEEEEEQEEEETSAEVNTDMTSVQAHVAKLGKTLTEMKKQKAEQIMQNKKKPTARTSQATRSRRPKAPAIARCTPVAGPSKPRKSQEEEKKRLDEYADFLRGWRCSKRFPSSEGEMQTDALAVINEEALATENIMGSEDDIEVEFDSLASAVIRRLYRTIVEPTKRRREVEVEPAETEKIRLLYARLSMLSDGRSSAVDVAALQAAPAQQPVDVDDSVSADERRRDEDDFGSE